MCKGKDHVHPSQPGQPTEPQHDHNHHDHHGCGGHGHKHHHHSPKGQPQQAAEPHDDHDHDHDHGGGGHGHKHHQHHSPKGQPQRAAEPHDDHDHDHDHGCGGHGHKHHHHHPPKGQPQQPAEPHHDHDDHDHSHVCGGGHGHGHHGHPGHDSHIDQPKQGQPARPHHDHDHHDHSHACEGHGHRRPDCAEANREYFDANAEDFENHPHAVERGVRTALALREAYEFDKDKTTVLDFACGTGLISQELAPYALSIKGVDISRNLVDRYNQKFAENNKHLSAVRVDLREDSKELEGNKFDVIFCASAYHHISSVEQTTRVLVSYLNPGGALFVVDMTKTEESSLIPEEYHHIVPHKYGFTEDEVRKLFEGAGLVSFSYKEVASGEGDVDLFIAKGIIPPSA